MEYQLEKVNGKFNLYSPKIERYVMEGVTMDEIKVALARDMEYTTKLEIVQLLMTFPHGYATTNDEVIVHGKAVKEFEEWYEETYQRIGFLDEYYARIDAQIEHVFSS